MKTYVVQLTKEASPAIESLVDTMLRAFHLAVRSSSAYRWNNINVGYARGPRWFDTDCPNAATALRLELSNIGIDVVEQPRMVAGDEWDKANLIER